MPWSHKTVKNGIFTQQQADVQRYLINQNSPNP
jgi:hypothetical protein